VTRGAPLDRRGEESLLDKWRAAFESESPRCARFLARAASTRDENIGQPDAVAVATKIRRFSLSLSLSFSRVFSRPAGLDGASRGSPMLFSRVPNAVNRSEEERSPFSLSSGSLDVNDAMNGDNDIKPGEGNSIGEGSFRGEPENPVIRVIASSRYRSLGFSHAV